MKSVHPLLLGHRGVRSARHYEIRRRPHSIPSENTLAAFDYALAQGCDGFEFDIRYTRDGRNVICHDPTLGGLKVAEVEFSELCKLDPSPIACLTDVLSRYADRACLDIEVKVGGNEESVVAAVHKLPVSGRILVSSFKPEVLRRLHELDPSLPLGYICDDRRRAREWTHLPITVFVPQQKLVSQGLIKEVHRHGLRVFTWTVNAPSAMLRLAGWGIDGLISDDPKLLVNTFR